MENVKETWAEELANFEDKPECIGYALKVLGTAKFPPTLPEFLEACRQAPRIEAPEPRYVPTGEEKDRSAEIAKRVAEVVSATNRIKNGIDYFWATHPKGYLHLKFIFEAARNDSRFEPCIAEMVEKGICTKEGRLLKRYAGLGEWVSSHAEA